MAIHSILQLKIYNGILQAKVFIMNKNKKIIGIIPARFASSRLPGKMLIKILDKTLLQRTFERVSLCPLLDDIFIATDDKRIYSHAKKINAKVIMTSTDCINGTERITQALQKIKELKDSDIIVNIQGDHPLLSLKTLEATIKILQNDATASVSTAATILKNKKDILSPNSVKVVFDKDHNALYFSRSPIPFTKNLDKTNFYYHIGIYAYRSDFLYKLAKLELTKNQIAEDLEQLTILEHGYRIKIALVEEKTMGVDTKNDVLRVKRYLCR